jgi:hypothetical protein
MTLHEQKLLSTNTHAHLEFAVHQAREGSEDHHADRIDAPTRREAHQVVVPASVIRTAPPAHLYRLGHERGTCFGERHRDIRGIEFLAGLGENDGLAVAQENPSIRGFFLRRGLVDRNDVDVVSTPHYFRGFRAGVVEAWAQVPMHQSPHHASNDWWSVLDTSLRREGAARQLVRRDFARLAGALLEGERLISDPVALLVTRTGVAESEVSYFVTCHLARVGSLAEWVNESCVHVVSTTVARETCDGLDYQNNIPYVLSQFVDRERWFPVLVVADYADVTPVMISRAWARHYSDPGHETAPRNGEPRLIVLGMQTDAD